MTDSLVWWLNQENQGKPVPQSARRRAEMSYIGLKLVYQDNRTFGVFDWNFEVCHSLSYCYCDKCLIHKTKQQ